MTDAFKLGLEVVMQFKNDPVPAAYRGRVVFPRCPFCKRRPELVVGSRTQLLWKTGFTPEHVMIPRYEILPCCSAQYKVEVNWVTKKQKLQAADMAAKRTGTKVPFTTLSVPDSVSPPEVV